MNIWIDIAVVSGLFALGNIFFGHFEQGTAKWRRVLKIFLMIGITAVIARTGGHAWTVAFVAAAATVGLSAHFIILRKHGIDPWTAETRDKYHALRGWNH